jgi:mycothiol synthase
VQLRLIRVNSLRLEALPDAAHAAWREEAIERQFRLHRLPMSGNPDAAYATARSAFEHTHADTDGNSRAAPVAVVSDGGVVGWVWLSSLGDSVTAIDARLDDPGLGAEVLELLEARARESGAARLNVARLAGDASTAALVTGEGFEPAWSHLVLDLTSPLPEPSVVLRPLTAEGFADWAESNVADFAKELMTAAAISWETAIEDAHKQFRELLPDGLATPGQNLWDALDGDQKVGLLWIAVRDENAGYVYDIAVDESQRGRGYGRATMDAGAVWCRDNGLKRLGLNVFGQNVVARRLYDSLGYLPVEETFKKSLR